jgi:hypothetical protein
VLIIWRITEVKMSGKLTNEIVDFRLKNTDYERIGNYVNNKTPISFRHKECGNIWNARPSNIFTGYGCNHCFKSCKLTNEVVDKRLKDTEYERVGNYINNSTPIAFRHKVCGIVWDVRPLNIFTGYGCNQCSRGKNEKLTEKILRDTTNFIILVHYNIIPDINDKRRGIFVDFYLPEINIVIEYDGKQHWQPHCFNGITLEKAEQNFAKQQERDYNEQNYCDQNGIDLIRIDGRKYYGKKLQKYVMEELVPQLLHMLTTTKIAL